jgi:transposase
MESGSTARSAREDTPTARRPAPASPPSFAAQLRRAEARGKPISSVPRARQGSVAGLSPTAKNVAALFMRHEEKLDEEQEEYLGRLCEADEALADTRRLPQEFAEMLRRLEGEDLDG